MHQSLMDIMVPVTTTIERRIHCSCFQALQLKSLKRMLIHLYSRFQTHTDLQVGLPEINL